MDDEPQDIAADRRRSMVLAAGAFDALLVVFVVLLVWEPDFMGREIVAGVKVSYVAGACGLALLWAVVHRYSRARFERDDVSSP
jgi:uncharacterized membrane protein (DUF485 family)